MVMNRTRPGYTNMGGYQMPVGTQAQAAPGLSANYSFGAAGGLSGTGLVMAAALGALVIFYIATKGIQGSR